MIAWLSLSSAFAAPAELTLLWAAPFTLPAPAPAAMLPERPAFREGTLLQLRMPSAKAVLGQGLEPALWVGDQPVRRWTLDPATGCVVALVEGPVDLLATPVFWGPAELAERLTPADASARLAEATKAGAAPFPAEVVKAALQAPVALAGAGALEAVVDGRRGTCSR